jgi:hypothetical protein
MVRNKAIVVVGASERSRKWSFRRIGSDRKVLKRFCGRTLLEDSQFALVQYMVLVRNVASKIEVKYDIVVFWRVSSQ